MPAYILSPNSNVSWLHAIILLGIDDLDPEDQININSHWDDTGQPLLGIFILYMCYLVEEWLGGGRLLPER
jgi:hypothetical protein